MKLLGHLYAFLLRFFKYIILYFIIVSIFVVIFSFIYSSKNVSDPFIFCIDVIWGTPETPENVKAITIGQKIFYDVFLVLFLGSFISQQIRPINPIEYSKYISFCKQSNEYFFRYWIILPVGKYLFDAKLRLIVTLKEEFNRGVNSLACVFEKEAEYNSIRGVRYFKISGVDASRFSNALSRNSSLIISLYIIGTNETGVIYSSVKRYKPADIMRGYKFISIRKSEYKEQAKKACNSVLKPSKKFLHKSTKDSSREFIRYQHFDKLYKAEDDAIEISGKNSKDILDANKIVNGQYVGPRQWLQDLYSWIGATILEKRIANK